MSEDHKLQALDRLTAILAAASRECLTTIAVVNDPLMTGTLALLAEMNTSVAERLSKLTARVRA